MVIYYRIKVINFQILMARISEEMKEAPNYILFRVHNTDLIFRHAEIATQRELEFRLPINPLQASLTNEEMCITFYKIHRTECLITLGKTSLNIAYYINLSMAQPGILIGLPPVFYLRNARRSMVAKLQCEVKLMVVNEIPPGLGYLNANNVRAGWPIDILKLMDMCCPLLPPVLPSSITQPTYENNNHQQVDGELQHGEHLDSERNVDEQKKDEKKNEEKNEENRS